MTNQNTYKTYEEEDSLVVVIYSKASSFSRIVLMILLAMSAIGFIGLVYNIVIGNVTDLFDVVLPFAIFGLMIAYIGRLFLWNSYGKEILEFTKETFSAQYDYKLFTSEIESLEMDYFSIGISNIKEEQAEITDVIDEDFANAVMEEGTLEIRTNGEVFQTVLKLPKEDLLKVLKLIKTYQEKLNLQ